VLTALKRVGVWRLGDVLELPVTKSEELKDQSENDEEWRERIVQYFLQTHPLVGWEWLSGELLRLGYAAAMEKVKVHIVPEEGMCVGTVIHVSM
jgi:hypothetical protein